MGDKCAIVSTLSMMKSESNEVVLGGCPRNYQADRSSIVARQQLAGDNRRACIEPPLFPTLGEPS